LIIYLQHSFITSLNSTFFSAFSRFDLPSAGLVSGARRIARRRHRSSRRRRTRALAAAVAAAPRLAPRALRELAGGHGRGPRGGFIHQSARSVCQPGRGRRRRHDGVAVAPPHGPREQCPGPIHWPARPSVLVPRTRAGPGGLAGPCFGERVSERSATRASSELNLQPALVASTITVAIVVIVFIFGLLGAVRGVDSAPHDSELRGLPVRVLTAAAGASALPLSPWCAGARAG